MTISSRHTVSLSNSITTDSVTLNSPNATLSQTGGTLTTGAVNISAGKYVLSGGMLVTPSYNNTGGTFATSVSASFSAPTFNNAGGTIEADTGGTISLALTGTVTTVQLGNLFVNGGAISLLGPGGTIDNTGQTFTFLGSSGSASIRFTNIENGAVQLSPSVQLNRDNLFGVTLASDIIASGDYLGVQNLNGGGHTINLAAQPRGP
jgi:hypothetical protein